MNPIQIGENAPDFLLLDQNEEAISLSACKEKKVLLSWHPLAWTPVCTDQMRALENYWGEFQNLNTIPLGCSVDPPPSKKAWASALLLENLRLICDFWPHGKTAQDYGIFDPQLGVSQRANIIIDENGKIKWIKIYPGEELPDINEVLNILSS